VPICNALVRRELLNLGLGDLASVNYTDIVLLYGAKHISISSTVVDLFLFSSFLAHVTLTSTR